MRKKALIICGFPAPYRIEVFSGLAKEYETDIFFYTSTDENRNKNYFCKSGDLTFYVLDNKAGKKRFLECTHGIKKYDFVILYEALIKPALYVMLRCRMYKIPYFVNCDGAFINKDKRKDIIKRWAFSHAKACFANGESAKEYFKYYGASGTNIYTHHFSSIYRNEILTDVVSQKEKSLLKEQLHLADMPTVISVGQFVPRKGFDVLLDAWKIVTKEAQLLIIGGGPEIDNYRKKIEEKNLKNVFLVDYKPKEIIRKYYMASDIFVLPTREDIWGLVINEAMALGLPVITTDMCNAGKELVKNGHNGYIVQSEDSEELAAHINGLLKDANLRKQMGQNNLNKMQDYIIENIAPNHIRVINSILTEENI